MIITASVLYSIISGFHRPDGTIDQTILPFEKLTKENQKWWEEKAKLLAKCQVA